MISLAISLGLILSFLSLELFGLSLGGLVVSGYLALEFQYPDRVLLLFLISIITYLIVNLLSNYMLMYGRRMLISAMLIGFILGETIFRLPTYINYNFDYHLIGYILPGIIAYWMHRQGVIRTICATIISASLINLALIVITRGGFGL